MCNYSFPLQKIKQHLFVSTTNFTTKFTRLVTASLKLVNSNNQNYPLIPYLAIKEKKKQLSFSFLDCNYIYC